MDAIHLSRDKIMKKIEKIVVYTLYVLMFLFFVFNNFIDIGEDEIYFKKVANFIIVISVIALVWIKYSQNKHDKLYVYFTYWMILILFLGIFFS